MPIECFPDAPAEWPRRLIADLATINPRYSLKKGREYPFVEMAAVGEKFRGITRFDRRKAGASGLAQFQANDILFAKITPCPQNGKVAQVLELPDEYGIGSTEFIVLSPCPGVDARFLYALVCSHAVRGRAVARMEGSTGRLRVPEDVFTKWLLIPEPPPHEQEAVARILHAVDASVKQTRVAIERARFARHAVIQNLLGYGVQRESQQNTEAGFIPQSWDCVQLGELIAEGPTNGLYRPESDYGDEGTPIVRIDSFDDGTIHSLNSLRRVRVDALIEDRYALKAGCILINRVNSFIHIGKAAIVPELDEPTIFESNMMSLVINGELRPEFLIIVLCSDVARRQWLARAKPAVNQASINQKDVRDFCVPLPKPDEQEEIASIVAAFDNRRLRLEDILSAQQQLKRALVQELLAGKVRVGQLSDKAIADRISVSSEVSA